MSVPRLSIGQKSFRVLQLLLGVRQRRVAAALKQHGFGEANLAEGWGYLQALTKNRLGVTIAAADPQMLIELDAWENRWFPIASASLASNYPEAHAFLFKNLSQTEGPEVIVSVGTFVERVSLLGNTKAEGGLGPTGKDARKRLEQRGLTTDVIAQAQSLLDRAGSIEPTDEDRAIASAEHDEKLERDLWNWYLEWSQIARVVVKDRRLLRQLGFLQIESGGSDDEGDPVSPTPAPTPVLDPLGPENED